MHTARNRRWPTWLNAFTSFRLWWPRVNRNTLKTDAMAGLTGAMIVLPQGVAFATTAISIALFAALQPFSEPGSEQFIRLALTLTFMVGLYQFILGMARMGTLVNFISHTVVIGFTAGAAVLIAAAMAGILFLVAWGLIDFHHFGAIWRTSKPETAILWVTLIGTLIDLEEGIFLGVLLSLILYLNRTSRPELVPVVPTGEPGSLHFERAKGRPECPQIRFMRLHGALYFGAVDHVQRALQQIDEENLRQKTVVLAAPAVNFVDVAGAGGAAP